MPDLSALYFKDVAYYDRGIFAQLMTLRNLWILRKFLPKRKIGGGGGGGNHAFFF